MTKRGFATRAIHAEDLRGTPEGTPVSTPIYQTANFAFATSDDYADVIQERAEGFVYTRLGNPTIVKFEEVLADLENAEAAVCVASGMAAVQIPLMSVCGMGDHIVSTQSVYGGTHSLFTKYLPRFGIETTFADATDAAAVGAAIRPNTKVLYLETICNPTLDVCDLEGLAALGHERGLVVMTDNTFATPYACNPTDLGVDVVIHSATKYLNGHADVIAGVMAGREAVIEPMRRDVQQAGAIAAPLTAWLLLRGLKTLAVRMERQAASALRVAQFLEGHPGVERVLYPGLPSHPQHELARRMLRSFSGMVACELKGGYEAGRRFMDALQLCVRAASLGECHTLATHPASTTHRQYTREEREAAGITDGFLRLSIGLEDVEDILADLEHALDQSGGQ